MQVFFRQSAGLNWQLLGHPGRYSLSQAFGLLWGKGFKGRRIRLGDLSPISILLPGIPGPMRVYLKCIINDCRGQEDKDQGRCPGITWPSQRASPDLLEPGGLHRSQDGLRRIWAMIRESNPFQKSGPGSAIRSRLKRVRTFRLSSIFFLTGRTGGEMPSKPFIKVGR